MQLPAVTTEQLVLAIDQGTSSTRVIAFGSYAQEICKDQIKIGYAKTCHEQYKEQDPQVYLDSTVECLNHVFDKIKQLNLNPNIVKAIGITNQRETIVLFNKKTGKALGHAIVWNDIRTNTMMENLERQEDAKKVNEKTGLRFNPYFSASKVKCLIGENDEVRRLHDSGDLCFSTVDTWILYNLTGGVDGGGVYKTDKTNASRTMLVDKDTFEVDDFLLGFFGMPNLQFPEICPSNGVFGVLKVSKWSEYQIDISGVIGDQSAALIGHLGFEEGLNKVTDGTGCFVMYFTGNRRVKSENLLSTILFDKKEEAPIYALEGSIQVCGTIIPWLEEHCGIKSSSQFGEFANLYDNDDIIFSSGFNGLMAPHWCPDVKGMICGASFESQPGNIIRAASESIAFEVKSNVDEIEKVMNQSSIPHLNVDGGLSNSQELMQIQCDITGKKVVIPPMTEPTALGVAVVAGRGKNVWKDFDDVKQKFSLSMKSSKILETK